MPKKKLTTVRKSLVLPNKKKKTKASFKRYSPNDYDQLWDFTKREIIDDIAARGLVKNYKRVQPKLLSSSLNVRILWKKDSSNFQIAAKGIRVRNTRIPIDHESFPLNRLPNKAEMKRNPDWWKASKYAQPKEKYGYGKLIQIAESDPISAGLFGQIALIRGQAQMKNSAWFKTVSSKRSLSLVAFGKALSNGGFDSMEFLNVLGEELGERNFINYCEAFFKGENIPTEAE